HRDLGHRHPAGLRDALDRVDDRPVAVEPERVPVEVDLGTAPTPVGAVVTPGRATMPPASGLHGMLPTPWWASSPNISRSSARLSRCTGSAWTRSGSSRSPGQRAATWRTA